MRWCFMFELKIGRIEYLYAETLHKGGFIWRTVETVLYVFFFFFGVFLKWRHRAQNACKCKSIENLSETTGEIFAGINCQVHVREQLVI